MRIFGFSRNPRGRRRAGTWVLLVAFLLLQVEAAVGGCLIEAAERFDAAAAMAHDDAAAAGPSEPCCPHGNVPTRECAEKCAPSASVSKATSDQAVAIAPLAFAVPLVVLPPSPGNASPVVHGVDAPTDPPAYLRFLRLLN